MGLQEKWLSNHAIEELLTAGMQDEIIPGVETRDYLLGEYIFREGDSSHEMFLIIAGRVLVFNERDHDHVVLAELEAPDFLGEMGCLQGSSRFANALALEDCRVLVIPELEVDRTISHLPRWFIRLLDRLIDRLRDADRRIVNGQISIQAAKPSVRP
jgi:CRP/FNR family cyclic AMP-dependent transcriptional regulator